MLDHLAQLCLRLQGAEHLGIHFRHDVRKAGVLVQLHAALEGAHAVVKGIRHARFPAGICRVGILDLVFAQIAAQRKAQQTGQRCKGLDAVLHCPVHKALLGQPHPGAAHPALVGLHHISLHRALGGCEGWIFFHHGLDVIGRAAHDGRVCKRRAIAQVAVLFQNAGEEGRHPVAVHEEMIPVKIDGVPLTAHAEKIAVRFLRDIALCTALIHKAGVRVRLQKKAPLFLHQLYLIVRCGRKRRLQCALQKSGFHRILQRKLVPTQDLLPTEEVHRSLKDVLRRALRLIHELLPRVCRQIIHQIPYGHKVAQLLFRDAQAEGLLEVCHNGQDLH